MWDEKIIVVGRFARSQNTHTCEPRPLVIHSGGSSRVNRAGAQRGVESKVQRVCFINETRFHLAEYKCFWRECQDESHRRTLSRLSLEPGTRGGSSTAVAVLKASLFVSAPPFVQE